MGQLVDLITAPESIINFGWKSRFFLQFFFPFPNHWVCLLDIALSSSTKPPSIFLLHARCWSHAFTFPSSTTVHPYIFGKFKMIPSITLILQSKSVRQGLILWTISVRGTSILLCLSQDLHNGEKGEGGICRDWGKRYLRNMTDCQSIGVKNWRNWKSWRGLKDSEFIGVNTNKLELNMSLYVLRVVHLWRIFKRNETLRKSVS